ncbi:UbiX family flavin prenyltransferase [Geobacter sp. FeAm09]|uniref:UbiX family flavin prenyltransferase n=1 Tax=Geobacter sp. FeAm09 TaxID=2597769 RepID=UPI0011ED30F4|nr:UbiX family flavin prenyltransferase [Geobacter sp. FeAm09]QEM70030.1 UbiX family flavin prenyltransferase [Geobacter sp. FeAm09]
MTTQKRVFVALTGASGAIYGIRLMEELLKRGFLLTVAASESGQLVCREETGLDLGGAPSAATARLCAHLGVKLGVEVVAADDLLACAASGSAAPAAMAVAPCSMGTLARIAHGTSGNLIERAADVMLKERRPLLLVPRETPLSEIHLENMLKLARAGVRIIPAMPAFYHRPATIDDLVNFVVGKVLDQLDIPNDLFKRWGDR